mgnify:CR=1 FL=1
MTVSSTTTTVSYTGNASTTSFSVTFPFLGTGSTSEITVVERVIATGVETTQVYTTDYTVTGGAGSTGTVIAATAPAATVEWHFRRNTVTTQTIDYVTNDPFPADTHELALDRLSMTNQEQDGDLGQTFKYPDTYTGSGTTVMPEPSARKALVWNSGGTALVNSVSDPDSAAAAAAVSAAAALVSEGLADADATQTALDVIATAADAASTAADVVTMTGATSTTSLLIAVASKAFTVASGLGFAAGDWVLATSDANPDTNYMHGPISSYSGTTLTINVDNIGGSGTLADWTIRRSGTQGATGATGSTGATGPTGPVGVGLALALGG